MNIFSFKIAAIAGVVLAATSCEMVETQCTPVLGYITGDANETFALASTDNQGGVVIIVVPANPCSVVGLSNDATFDNAVTGRTHPVRAQP